ncbi:hypothetical protein KY345_04855, partial [Candidatus Woesearchaeota archaeon]|nr:hypothetical protein [Candidatus Woesearchaeota archaeon]
MNGLKRIKEEKVPEAVKALMAQKISEEKVPVEVRQFMELQTISEQDVPEEVKQLVQTETKEIETKEPKKSFWTKIKETGKELKDIGGVKGLFKMAKGLGMPDVDATEAQAAESVGKRKAYAAEQEDLYFFDVQRAITDPTYKKRKEEISKAGIETTIQSLKETPQAMAELGAELTSSALFGWKKPLEWTESKGYTGRVEDVPAKIAGNTLRIAVELATAGAAGKVIEKSIAPITARLGRFGPIAAKWIASGVEGMVFWGEDETLDQALDYLDKEKALTWENIGKSTKAINDEAIAGGAIQFLNFIPRTSIRVPLTMGARYWRETKKEARELTPKAKSKKIYKTGFQGLYSLFFGGMRLPEQEPEFIDVTP